MIAHRAARLSEAVGLATLVPVLGIRQFVLLEATAAEMESWPSKTSLLGYRSERRAAPNLPGREADLSPIFLRCRVLGESSCPEGSLREARIVFLGTSLRGLGDSGWPIALDTTFSGRGVHAIRGR